MIHLKRHAGDLADLTQAEIIELFRLVKNFEDALRQAFDATMFNWSSYMNNAYKETPPNPHVHWWAVPRYDHIVEFDGRTFEDPNFGNPYDHGRWFAPPHELRHNIANRIKANLVLLRK
jgi:diadenosine tetraphosphate (Ap4A) HIT family hydrolase